MFLNIHGSEMFHRGLVLGSPTRAVIFSPHEVLLKWVRPLVQHL